MKSIAAFQLESQESWQDNYRIQYDMSLGNEAQEKKKEEIQKTISDIEIKLDEYQLESNAISKEIDFYTNNSDKLDIIISASSGIITAALDAVLKEMRLKKVLGDTAGKDLLDFLNLDGAETVNKGLDKLSDSKTLKNAVGKSIQSGNSEVSTDTMTNESLKGVISFLEKRFNIPSDSVTTDFGGSLQHHLRDFAHHPSIVGLIFSLLTQFTMCCYGTDTSGKFISVKLEFIEGKEGRIAKGNKEIKVIGENIGEKILFGTVIWFYHLVSDCAGSSNTPGAGMGLPGPIMSFAKELSALPIFRKTDENGNKKFSVWLSKLYNGTLFAKRDENGKILEARKIDLRTEVGLAKELGKEALPVLLNEFIVRGFYFIKRLVVEIKTNNIKYFRELKEIDPKKILPFKNRTITRMLTVATGSFTATNLAAAAVMSGVKSGGNPAAFVSGFVMRINFVGVGRFAIAIKSDITGGIKKSKYENEKFAIEYKMLMLTNVKLRYMNVDTLLALAESNQNVVDIFDAEEKMWVSAKKTAESLEDMLNSAFLAGKYFADSWDKISESTSSISKLIDGVEQKNPGLFEDLMGPQLIIRGDNDV